MEHKRTGNLSESLGTCSTQVVSSWIRILPTQEWMCSLPVNVVVSTCSSYPGPPNWSSYQFEVSAWEGGNVTTGLVVTQHSGSFNILGWYELVGMIRNDTSQGAEYVQSIATLYNKADRVVGCDLTFVTADTLSPGESSSFKHLISSVDEDEFDRYRLQTEAKLSVGPG